MSTVILEFLGTIYCNSIVRVTLKSPTRDVRLLANASNSSATSKVGTIDILLTKIVFYRILDSEASVFLPSMLSVIVQNDKLLNVVGDN